jgi:hypothetical protein
MCPVSCVSTFILVTRPFTVSLELHVEKRYEGLGQLYRQLGLEEDAAWVGSRLEKIR